MGMYVRPCVCGDGVGGGGGGGCMMGSYALVLMCPTTWL